MTPTVTYIGLAIAVAVLIWGVVPWGKLGGAFGRWWNTAPVAPVVAVAVVDNDAADMVAFRRLEARFIRIKCKDGQDAMKVVATHFLHSEGA